jgi:hypothetical protein
MVRRTCSPVAAKVAKVAAASDLLRQSPRPFDEVVEELADEHLRLLVRQVPVCVEPLRGVADHYLGLVDGEHVEEDHHLPHVVLRPRRADDADGGAHDGGGLTIPSAVAVGARRPVYRVLEHARDRVVVLGRDEQDGVGLADTPLQFQDLFRRLQLLVLVEAGDAGDLKDVHGRARGDEFGRGAQGGAVVRGAPEASVRAVNNLAEALGMRAAVVLVPAKEEVLLVGLEGRAAVVVRRIAVGPLVRTWARLRRGRTDAARPEAVSDFRISSRV